MERYADVIVDISHEKLDRPFQYRIPERLYDGVTVGSSVNIPFGKGNRLIKGIVTNISESCDIETDKIKDIAGLVDKGVSVEDRMIEIAAFIKRNYGSTMIQALKTVLPAKQTVKPVETKYIIRTATMEETISAMGQCQKKHQTAKARLLKALIEEEVIPRSLITSKLGVTGQTIQSLEKVGIIRTQVEQGYRNPVKLNKVETKTHELSEKQQAIVDEFSKDYKSGKRGTYLIHGVTGSGKTEVYMKLIEMVISEGKQVIMLIPEIALTYQTLIRFYSRFGERVSVINSSLSAGEKYDQCQRAKNGELDIIIGPRSALFTPFPDLGLIIMDEEHEGSYKSESSPKYHARETAIELAGLNNASVVLGSATPSLEAYYRAMRGEYTLFKLNERISGKLPKVHIVDLRQELKEGNKSIFSRKLFELLADRINKGEQSMLFLNRRGYAGFISCRACGHVMKCPHCDVSMSEHKGGKLICHYCGYGEVKPRVCPECGSKYIGGFRAGTQQIEEKLKEIFPNVRTLRMDADTTRTKDSYEKILSSFANEEADVLIGTQMIVKGHDFPRVTLVGVIAADMSLGVGDYRASEKTFELLTQAVGRAGRGELSGEAVIQTYQPDHYAVICSATQNYEDFYEEEILYREMSDYPPVAHMLAVQIYSKYENSAERLSCVLADEVKKQGGNVRIIGPAPANISKINDIFRFVFYIKSSKYDTLVELKDYLEAYLQKTKPVYDSVQFDFDPVNTI